MRRSCLVDERPSIRARDGGRLMRVNAPGRAWRRKPVAKRRSARIRRAGRDGGGRENRCRTQAISTGRANDCPAGACGFHPLTGLTEGLPKTAVVPGFA
ncbi:hypothetical protein [Burkholderia sp. PU8-34]